MSEQIKDEDHLGGIMLGQVVFKGQPMVGIKVGDGVVTLFHVDYMLRVYDQLGDILYNMGALEEEVEGEDEDKETGFLQ